MGNWHFWAKSTQDGSWREPVAETWNEQEVMADLIDRLTKGYKIYALSKNVILMIDKDVYRYEWRRQQEVTS
jgi:hypothetical protein